jgi:hypothetical protein
MPDPLGRWQVDVTAPGIDQVKAKFAEMEAELTKALALEKQLHGSTEVVSQGMTKLAHAGRGAGLGILQVSYAIDDLQYGFRAIVNNIPQIVYMMGGGAGIAGAVGIAAVAVNQLINRWTDLTAAFQSNWASETASGLKHIAEAAENAANEYEKLWKAKTKAQGKESEKVGEAITEGGTQQVMGALMVAIQGDKLAAVPEKFEPGQAAVGPGAIPMPSKTQEEIDRETRQKNVGIIKGLLGQAKQPGPEGDRARAELARLARKAPEGSLPQGFVSDIENASPEAQKAQSHFEKMAEARKRIEADIETKRKEHAQKAEQQGHREAALAKEIFAEKKKERIEALQDQEKAIMRQKHQIAENLWQAEHQQRPGQILQGAKAALDLFQTSGGGNRELQMKAHRLQEEANKKLDKIKDAIEKQQRAGVILTK